MKKKRFSVEQIVAVLKASRKHTVCLTVELLMAKLLYRFKTNNGRSFFKSVLLVPLTRRPWISSERMNLVGREDEHIHR
jgi:hypothetical protein